MKKLLLSSLVLAAALAAIVAAQELAPPTSAGANETVTLKKRARISNININRGDAIIFSTEISHIDNATDLDRKVVPGPQTLRPLTPAMLATQVGGTGATLGQMIAKLGDFYAQFRAEDVAAQNP